MANFNSSPNPYTDRRYGAGISATQGFLNSYMQHLQLQQQMKRDFSYDKYRQSLMDINRSRLDISRQQFGLAERKEKRMALGGGGFSPSEIMRIRKEAEEGLAYETPEDFFAVYNPEQDPMKAQQLQTFWDIGHQEEEPEVGKRLFGIPGTATTWNVWPWQKEEYNVPTEKQLTLEPTPNKRMDLTSVAPTKKVFEQKSPYPEYPDAFQENGVWKVMQNGKKYRIEE